MRTGFITRLDKLIRRPEKILLGGVVGSLGSLGAHSSYRDNTSCSAHAVDSILLGFIQNNFIKTDTLPPFGQKRG